MKLNIKRICGGAVLLVLTAGFYIWGGNIVKSGTPYKKAEFDAVAPADSGIENGLDINTASAEAFMEIKGIGPVYSESIIKARDEMGGFKSVDDLLYAEGIGDKRLELLEQYASVNKR